MKQIHRIILFTITTVIFLQACEEATDWEYHSGENGKLVVDAILTSELKEQEIRLSLSYDDLNGIPTPVSNATVSINNGQNDFAFQQDPGAPGKYHSPQAASAEMGVNYQLTIQLDGETYTAENEMVEVLPLPNISFQTIGQSDSMKLRDVSSLYSTTEQVMYEVYIDWSHLSSNEPNQVKQMFYSFNTIDVNGVFRPDQQDVFFPRGSIVTVKKYGLNKDFAAFLRALVMETEWQGGVLDEASASLPTNVSNGGLGYFGVCAVRTGVFVAE